MTPSLRSCTVWLLTLALVAVPVILRSPAPAHAQEGPILEASEQLLIGTWDVDVPGLLIEMGEQLTAEQRAMAEVMLADATMRTVYRSDGTASLTGDGPGFDANSVATWATVTVEGNQLTIMMLEDKGDGQTPAPEMFTITFESPDRMVMVSESEPMRVPFVRGVDDPNGTPAAAPGPPAPPVPLPAPHPITGAPVELATIEHLHGAWNADLAGMLAAEAANMSPEETAMMVQMLGGMEITFSFVPDGSALMSMTGMGQAETKTGAWALVGTSGNTVQFTLTETPTEGEAMPIAEAFTATFQTENNMTLTKEGDPQVIPFYRE